VVARAINSASPRADKAFVPVNCAGIPETLLESELFGHVKGSFTGAYRDKPGKLEMSDNGTIFLDEIGEMTLRMQGLLLLFLETGEIPNVGSERVVKVTNVRFFTATNRHLRDLISEGLFREDLYYRINVFHIDIPPLRERREDIPILMDHFLARYFRERGEEPKPTASAVRQAFLGYSWPGNVRELENACERVAQTCTCDAVRLGCVPASVLFHPQLEVAEPVIDMSVPRPAVSLDERLAEVESRLITWALKVSHGNKSRAAEVLKIKRSTLGDRIKKLGLDHLEVN